MAITGHVLVTDGLPWTPSLWAAPAGADSQSGDALQGQLIYPWQPSTRLDDAGSSACVNSYVLMRYRKLPSVLIKSERVGIRSRNIPCYNFIKSCIVQNGIVQK